MSELEQLYQQVILDHARARSGSGSVPEDISGSSHQVNPTCGDEVTLGVDLAEDGSVKRLVWDGSGCSISQASLSMMSEMVVGMGTQEREHLAETFSRMMHSRGAELSEDDLDELADAAALSGASKFPARVKCALLGWMALRDAIATAETKES
ncbi:Fe-S cluster assembly sulfur transfer protein SufU [Boudabousia marimammalium]|uniref:SUF system NifU family Fe-S cluster assembly protein n=1 Tax=Boudabousia marimammalium TaxID=156892 RepID=A0A1Q5PR20_9ACTO|nr:SUF system NifU family Fe-S cluster assembly protein [Boudabousia marimammalium]OKL50071.1 SUF system NifU family Fe-S cluster assembly protein [Boudabousia marimammalium]